MKHFLSCDWGTSSLRLRLADTGDGKIIAEARSADGIARTFELWRQTGLSEDKKTSFYLEVIDRQVKKLENDTGRPLKGLKLVLSGMASSTVGFIDLPYTSIPFNINGKDMVTAFVAAGRGFDHDIMVISGARSAGDVMRGEETQLIGCIQPGRPVNNALFIFPGTHSKHILVSGDQAIGLKTYMTGEVFGLLAGQSMLKNTVQPGCFDADAFKKGLIDAASGNLLHLIFKVRTNGLFNAYTKNENYHYLSGLLIGTELKDLASANAEAINLVCGNKLAMPYHIALSHFSAGIPLKIYPLEQAEEATVKGQLIIAKHLNAWI
jgi:2-dehydro-3-deoxygalactonokinase